MALHALSHPNPLATRIRALASEKDPASLVDHEGTILFVNEAWERSLRENTGGAACLGEALVGTAWLDHVAGAEPRRQHQRFLELALHRMGNGPGGSVIQVSENNSPTLARLIATHFEPIVTPSREVLGVTVVHRLVRERPLTEVYSVVSGPDSEFLDSDGRASQCSCCRRTLHGEDWEFVPELLASSPAKVEYVFCPLCLDLHYLIPEDL